MAEMLAQAPKNQQCVKKLEKKLECLELQNRYASLGETRKQLKDRDTSAASGSMKTNRGDLSVYTARSRDDRNQPDDSAGQTPSLRSRFQTAIGKLILHSKVSKQSQLESVITPRAFDLHKTTDASLRGSNSEVLSPLPSPKLTKLSNATLSVSKIHSSGYLFEGKRRLTRRKGGTEKTSIEQEGPNKHPGKFKLRLSKTYLRNIFLEHRREDEESLEDSKDLENLQKSTPL